ncbi:hypothetical protein GWK18_04875 [Kocuria sp. JC486]|uniref:endonuclease domain-containing protein n=1 Tax=Kocuria sp. JC486 TaxID=1970736 RepID=UPI001423A731|nr:hypothetical protein [Kocuria sp. JC486]NHU84931.1 hypothetical protein [Kocuria sp. JC486]
MDRWFTVREATEAGLTRSQLWGSAYTSITRGVWAVSASDVPERSGMVGPGTPEGLAARLPALQEVCPDSAASHVTAAVLLGFRLSQRVVESPAVHLTCVGHGNPPRGPAVQGHECLPALEDVWEVDGMRVTSPIRTLIDLAGAYTRRKCPVFSDSDLVGIVDGVINEHETGINAGRPALRTRSGLAQDLGGFHGCRGVARLRSALDRAAVGVDSVLETKVRLLLEDHGLTGWTTDLQLQAPGHRAVWPDLADVEHRIAIQVEGAHHDGHDQRLRDIERQRATEALGWTEIRVMAADLNPDPLGQGGTVPRVVRMVRAARKRSLPPAEPSRNSFITP